MRTEVDQNIVEFPGWGGGNEARKRGKKRANVLNAGGDRTAPSENRKPLFFPKKKKKGETYPMGEK